MTRSHGAAQGSAIRRPLLIATGANILLLIAQVVGGFLFDSLTLLADSVHQGSDVLSLVLAVFIVGLVARPPTSKFTFGLGRADALGGLAHSVLLLGGAVLVTIEAFGRFGEDVEVEATGVIVLAVIGLVINAWSARALHGSHGHSLNIRGAMWHLVADALGSFLVLVSGVVIAITGESDVDVWMALLVAALVVWSAWTLGRAAVVQLLDAVPPGVDVEAVRRRMLDDPDVTDAHHLHVRTLHGSSLSLSAHVQVDTDELHHAQVVTERLTRVLVDGGIDHVTLQVECHPCDTDDCN